MVNANVERQRGIAMRPNISDIQRNSLLAALPERVIQRMAPDIRKINLVTGQAVYQNRGSRNYVYFPTTAILAWVISLTNGKTTEVAVVGHEGMISPASLAGRDRIANDLLVTKSGSAFRLRADAIRREADESTNVARIFRSFSEALLLQVAHTAVCNQQHSTDKHLSRWLLLNMDRMAGGDFEMTQDGIGQLLGVRRQTVAEYAKRLESDGVIRYSRGRITVLDRAALEKTGCECYEVMKAGYEDLRYS